MLLTKALPTKSHLLDVPFLAILVATILSSVSMPASAGMITLNANRDAATLATTGSGVNEINCGGLAWIQTGKSLGAPTRAMVGFDMSPLAAETFDLINSITLRLVVESNTDSGAGKSTNVYAISNANADWVEGTSSGSVQTGSSSWDWKHNTSAAWAGSGGLSTAGTDYNTPLLASQSFATVPADNTIVNFPFIISVAEMTSLIDGWLNDTNGGLLLFDPNETTLGGTINRITFHSTEASTVDFRPQLIVEFSAVPEPSSLLLLGVCLFAAGPLARGRRARGPMTARI